MAAIACVLGPRLPSAQSPAERLALGGRIIAVSALVWFALDSFGSVIAGAAMNAVFNLGFLLVLLVPLALAREPSMAAA